MPPTPLALKAIEVALSERGRGEQGGNNVGPDITRYRRSAKLDWSSGPWCAVFCCFAFRRASVMMGHSGTLPFAVTPGAKKLVRNVAAAGRYITVPEEGAVICWHRSALPAIIDWRGHVGLILSVDGDSITTVEGNKVSTVEVFTYPNGLWRKRLYRMAAL